MHEVKKAESKAQNTEDQMKQQLRLMDQKRENGSNDS